MTTITKYVATDGREFVNQEDCQKYEDDGCVFFCPIPKYGDHMELTQENLESYGDTDGDLYYATATKMSRKSADCPPHPAWATHLVHFGK